MTPPSLRDLRLATLAVSVLADVDLTPAKSGVLLTGAPQAHVSWTECRRALSGHAPDSPPGRRRLTDWLLARRWCADLGRSAVQERMRPVGLPVDHVSHPGLDWVRDRVFGDALDLGLGAVDLDPEEPDRVVLLPTSALNALGVDVEGVWAAQRDRLETLGALAAERTLGDPKGVLRTFGDCDAITLLGARSLRAALAEAAHGMAAAVVPMRSRGWTRLSQIDPAFGPAAAAATSAPERGFTRPLLLTADELTIVADGGRPTEIVLRDPVGDTPWTRDVLFR